MKYQELPSLEVDGSRPSSYKGFFEILKSKVFMIASAMVVGAFTLLVLAGGTSSSPTSMSSSNDVCKSPDYSKTTLKTAYEGSFIALMKDTKHQKKFEASDVIFVDGFFYAICDNSWAIERITDDLTPYSSNNVQVGDPARESEDSGYEAIFHDDDTNIFYVVRESVEMKGLSKEKEFHALVEEIRITGDDYIVERTCPSEFEFAGSSKGFEGAVGLKDAHGKLYMLGLCEGNFCDEGKRGRVKGNGEVVVMKLEEGETGTQDDIGGKHDCMWKTVRHISIPSSANFQDYSAIAINSQGRVVITSQEESQVWMGTLTHTESGVFDPLKSEFVDDSSNKVLNFPRDTNCEVVYCNIEGIHWVNDELLVGVSDKMKSKGKQDFRCLEKDQSIHMFVMP